MSSAVVGSFSRAIRLPQLYLYFSGLVLLTGLALSLGGYTFISPWLRVVVALLVFLLPGAYLFALVPARDSWDIIDVLGYGFAFSVALITVLGLITRTLALSIDTVEFIWYSLALLGFVAVIFRTRGQPRICFQARPATVALLAIVLVQGALYVYAAAESASRRDDRDRHHAETNSFLREEPLGWAEPYYETGNLIADRMYLTYWVLAQALAVEISGVPILLARYLIQPFVAIASMAAMYIFARNLGHGRTWSLLVVILSLFAYSLLVDSHDQPASHFLVELIFDKTVVGFALAPLAMSSACLCYRKRNWRACFAFALTMFAATCVHSLVAGFAFFIILLWCLILWLTDKEGRRQAIQIGLLAAVIFSPAILLRITTGDTTIYNFGGDRANIRAHKILQLEWENPLDDTNIVYMIHPQTAGDPTYIILGLTILALLTRRADARAKLMWAFFVAAALGLLPYASSLYGRLVSVNHIIRVLWLLPYGYMLFFVVDTALTQLKRGKPRIYHNVVSYAGDRALIAICVLALLLTAHSLARRGSMDFTAGIAVSHEDLELLAMADYIESNHDDRVWFAGSPRYRRDLISATGKAIALSRYSADRMVYYSRLSAEQAAMQENDNFRLFKADASVAEKLTIIDRYGIDYLLFHEKYAWMIDGLYQQDKSRFELVYRGQELRLVRIH